MKKIILFLIFLSLYFILSIQNVCANTTDISDIHIKTDSVYLDYNQSIYLSAIIKPSDVSNQSVTWSSSDTNIASINAFTGGMTTKTKKGVVTITATSNINPNVKGTIDFYVGYNAIKVNTETSIGNATPISYSEVVWEIEDQTIIKSANKTAKNSINGMYRHFIYLIGLKEGSTNVTMKTISGDVIMTSLIYVYNPITSIKYSSDKVIVGTNENKKLDLIISPNDISEISGGIIYTSENDNIVSIDNEGYIIPHQNGSTKFNIYSKYGNILLQLPVEVVTYTESLDLDTYNLNLTDDNDNHQIIYNILPKNASNKSVIFESSDESVVTVSSSGLVTAINQGNATITVKTQDGKQVKYISVTSTEIRKNIKNLNINSDNVKNVVYNGNPYTPNVEVFDGEYELIKGIDYTVDYDKNISVGTADIIVSGKGKYKGNKIINFEIEKANINYTANDLTVRYDGKNYGIDLNVETEGIQVRYLDSNDEYTLMSMPKYSEIGTYTIGYKLIGGQNYNDIYGENSLTIKEPKLVSIKSDVDSIDFGELYNDSRVVSRRYIEIVNNGNVSVKLKYKKSTNSAFTCETGLDNYILEPGEKLYGISLVTIYREIPGTYEGDYIFTATEINGTKSYEMKLHAKLVVKGHPIISYTTHVQTYGWQNYVKNGQMAGTTGEKKRLEGIKIKLENQDYAGNIEYRTHIQKIGWEDTYKKNNEMSGTEGMAYRLEAIQIRLTGEMAEHYDVYYRVHAQKFGWLGWAKNGEQSGTAAYKYRLEGIEIQLVEKGGSPKENEHQNDNKPFYENLLEYTTHVQSYGWQDYVPNGQMAGTTGEKKRLEGIKINLVNQKYAGDIEYRTHIQKIGWEDTYKKNNEMSGTEGMAYRLEAIQIRLTGEMAEHYDVYYRVHAQKFGWLGWAKNGEQSGTAGYAYRLEGIEIQLVEKGQMPTENEHQNDNEAFYENK